MREHQSFGDGHRVQSTVGEFGGIDLVAITGRRWTTGQVFGALAGGFVGLKLVQWFAGAWLRRSFGPTNGGLLSLGVIVGCGYGMWKLAATRAQIQGRSMWRALFGWCELQCNRWSQRSLDVLGRVFKGRPARVQARIERFREDQ